MERRSTRREKAAETKQKIFETAVRLIKENGYNNVTVSEICRAAGVAKGSFYVHYNSKEDVVRASYHTDMSAYMQRYHTAFLETHPNASYDERIIYFMELELRFAEYAGYEMTCLAYALNLGTCVPGPSEHLTQRGFSEDLYDAIQKNSDNNISPLSSDEVFCYFESAIRGLMATWCFSNASFSIVERGKKYIPLLVYSIYAEPGA